MARPGVSAIDHKPEVLGSEFGGYSWDTVPAAMRVVLLLMQLACNHGLLLSC